MWRDSFDWLDVTIANLRGLAGLVSPGLNRRMPDRLTGTHEGRRRPDRHRPFVLLQIALDGAGGALRRGVGVLAGVPLGPALAQRVP